MSVSSGKDKGRITDLFWEILLCRLDFANFVLAQPEVTDNKCKDDMFIVTGGPPVPSICGVNTGSHSEKYFRRGNIFI